ncbi:nuclear transport factor 2 family protein [Algoriphagus hitonicola]|nr:nuclear transport factor 2 family protein [Algoriphagus hitonicola]
MNLKLTLGMLALAMLSLYACEEQKEQAVIVEEEKIDIINDEFPESKAEVIAFMEDIKQAIIAGDIDRLISFHAYGPKFTEFKNGEPRNDGTANEEYERGVFGNVTGVEKFEYDDLKVAIYDQVANVTFHSDFHLKFGEDDAVVNEQITLLLAQTDMGWKIIHEHHSPLNSPAAE